MPDGFIVVPKGFDAKNIPPDKLQFLHEHEKNFSIMEGNAEIVGFEDEVELIRMPYDHAAADRLGATLPKLTVRVKEGEKVQKKVLGDKRMIAELRMGYPPIKQVIMIKCMDGLTREEICKLIIDDLGWFPKGKQSTDWVNQTVDELIQVNMLSPIGDKMVTGPMKIAGLGNEGYPIKKGSYPIHRLIQDITKKRGRVTQMELEDAVHNKWGWTESRSSVAYWIKSSLKKRYIREVEAGSYETFEEIQSWDPN